MGCVRICCGYDGLDDALVMEQGDPLDVAGLEQLLVSTEEDPGVPHRIPLSGESGSVCSCCLALSVKIKRNKRIRIK